MKYQRLSQEQFKEMHQEFINFLASQSITADEWEEIKKNKPEVAEEELDIFSDLIWEGVLRKVKYLEHYSPQHLFLFSIDEDFITLIGVKVKNETINITTREGYRWLQQNLAHEDVELYTSKKALKADRNKDVFALIQQGAQITKGELFAYFLKIVD